jgi:SAM-dependent methyltransferase
MQCEAVRGLCLEGRYLDIGGGGKASYLPLLQVKGVLESVNLDPTMCPTYRHDLSLPLPFGDSTYDGFISLSTFEHLFRDEFALSEALRITKPGGQFHIVVPFLYHIHTSPSDYSRHTPYWWVSMLTGLGVPRPKIIIDPLVWSRACSGIALVERQAKWGWRALRVVAMLPPVLRDSMSRQPTPGDRLYDTGRNRVLADHSLGFHIRGEKGDQ